MAASTNMDTETGRRPRGRPRKVTREAIAAAGRRLTLPHATMAGIAEELGVGIRTLYKHTDGIEDVQVITAEEIFVGWGPPTAEGVSLEQHLLDIALSLRDLALENPGIARFLLRNSQSISPRVVEVMDGHQQYVARSFGLPLAQASMVVATVAEHALAVTDAVHSDGGRERDRERMAQRDDLPALSAAARERPVDTDSDFFVFGVRALVHGLVHVNGGAGAGPRP